MVVLSGCSHSGGSAGGSAISAAPPTIELGGEPKTTFTAKYRSDLVQVDHDTATQSLVATSPDGSAFVFEKAPDSILKATPGTTVLLAGFALRKVASVRTNGDFSLVQTDPASITDAVTDGTIAWDHTVAFGANGQISDARDMRGRFGAEPALADTPVTVSHTGTANGWQYTTHTTVGDNSLNIDETLARQDAGMQITMHAKGKISNFNTSADIEIQNGQVVKFTYLNKNLIGTIDFEWTATKSSPGVGALAKTDRFVTLPPLVSIPLDIEGLPFTLNVDSAMLVEPAFTAASEGSTAHFIVNFSGDQGFTVQNGDTTRVGNLKGDVDIGDDTNAISPIAASAFVGALSLPKLELKPGITPDALVPTNGAFADRAKQMLAQSGYSQQLNPSEGVPAGGSYVQLITSGGLMDFGSADAPIPCQQATMELSLKVGNAASLGVSSSQPNETYLLKTWHRINPAVQYCARGLTSNPPSKAIASSSAAPCDPAVNGNATDYYGVAGGKTMQKFLNGGHGGIDVEHLRDDPVFANIREDVPLDELNSAMMLATKQATGVGVTGTGTAHLIDAQVIGQLWFPGCSNKGPCDSPSMDNSYGAMVGLAAHYAYGDKQIFTAYIEYEHLISPAYPPRKDNGAYIDNQGQTIGAGDYVSKQLGCYGFGTLMKNGATLSADQLREHPLIGYLGATEHAHVHIQTAFGLKRLGYIHSNYFDPGIVVVH